MSRAEFGSVVGRIFNVLHEGPATAAEIREATGLPQSTISTVIARMNRPSKTMKKRVFIKAYTREVIGEKRYPRAIYALGDGKDARYPGPDTRGNRLRYDATLKARRTLNSVFNAGLSRRLYGANRATNDNRTEAA